MSNKNRKRNKKIKKNKKSFTGKRNKKEIYVKSNYASNCAEIDFSYKQDANIVGFPGNFATSSESA